MPGDISTGEVKVHAGRDGLSKNFGACGCPERVFVGAKKDLAILGLRTDPQQRPECMTMHHAEALVVIGTKNQGVDVVAPRCRIVMAAQANCRVAILSDQAADFVADEIADAAAAVANNAQQALIDKVGVQDLSLIHI